MKSQKDFFTAYLNYATGSETEIPAIGSRWSAIASIGALLGKSIHLRFGSSNIYPNIYCMLIGTSGSRKSAAIKKIKPLLVSANYTTIAASKTTKEKFMLDLSGIDSVNSINGDDQSILDKNLFGDSDAAIAESFIMADEFNDFFGNNNLEFISLLGSLWDWEGPYENRIKNGKSFIINNPTISILGGNTPTGFSAAFPPEILGQGFFSRILLVYCEPKGNKVPWPRIPAIEETVAVVELLKHIRTVHAGEIEVSKEAKELLGKIYNTWRPINDIRFDSYSTRRFTHLLKLCIIHAIARFSPVIESEDVVYTNTVLSYAERLMPKALGEFGKSKNSDVTHKIIQLLDQTDHAMTTKEIWRHVSNDLENMSHLSDLLRNLLGAEKIQTAGKGFLNKKEAMQEVKNDVIDWSLLTDEERKII